MGHSTEHHEHHITSFKLLTNVCIALGMLTILTVVTAKLMSLGAIAPLVAFIIAGAKAYMVMAYFMGLKYDDPLNRLIFGSGFAFLFLLWIICAIDIWTRYNHMNTL